jgi:hypothetical protein
MRTCLDVHEIIDANASQLRELLTALFKKRRDRIALLTLYGHIINIVSIEAEKNKAGHTTTDFRCPLPSQYEYVISTSSSFISSCRFNHSCLSSSRCLLSSSSRSRSGKNEVSTSGFLRNLARLEARSSAVVATSSPSPSPSPSSAAVGVLRDVGMGVDDFDFLAGIMTPESPSPSSSSIANESVAFCCFFRFFIFFCSSLNVPSTRAQQPKP